MAKVVQDMIDTTRALFKEGDHSSDHSYATYDPRREPDPRTPSPLKPLHSNEWGSSNFKYQDANTRWASGPSRPGDNSAVADENISNGAVTEDIVPDGDDGGRDENDDNLTPRHSTEGGPLDDAASTGEGQFQSNRADGDAEPNPHAEHQYFIKSNTKKNGEYIPLNVGLYQAALKGDWKTAKSILTIDPTAFRRKITDSEETALHIAAAAKHAAFVEKLVELMSSADLAITNSKKQTAMCFAAVSGVVRIAKVMVEKNPELANIHEPKRPTPVMMAVAYRRKHMASYLFSKTNFEALETSEQIELLIATISNDYYDIALDILKMNPKLATGRIGQPENKTSADGSGETALHVLARKPSSSIGSSGELGFWKKHINSRFKGIYEKALMRALAHQVVTRIWAIVLHDLSKVGISRFIKVPSRLLHDAARVGNAEFLIILIRSYPDLIWKVDDDDKSIFHIAVENRQESVFNLIYDIGGLKDFVANFYDRKKNMNLLHLAGKLAAPNHLNRVSGAALQMQRELLWFKEVENIVVSSSLEMRCIDVDLSEIEVRGNPPDYPTPHELFTKEHKELREAGEKWMKDTANSCMLVATLIATVVFAAAFTVPGGNDSGTGTPLFRGKQPFTVFVISDVTALISSTTSILIFLSILTSRYAEGDFLVSLPTKLLLGLLTLFVSIVCMVVAFSATFFMVYDKAKARIPLAIAVVAILPVTCFCVLQSRLVVDILRTAYGSKVSFMKRKLRLF